MKLSIVQYLQPCSDSITKMVLLPHGLRSLVRWYALVVSVCGCLSVCQCDNGLRYHYEIFMSARYVQKPGQVQKWLHSDTMGDFQFR